MRSFAKGFKRARKKKGFTQETFTEAFETWEHGFSIPTNTVRNWEQGRSIPEWKTIDLLCDFFECDMDYLFNTIEQHTHGVAFICDYTGLSEETAKKLHHLSKCVFPDDAGALSIDFLNFIVSDNHVSDQFHRMIHYIESAVFSKIFAENAQKSDEYCYFSMKMAELSYRLNQSGFEIVSSDDTCDFRRLSAERVFSEIVDLYVNMSAKTLSSFVPWDEVFPDDSSVEKWKEMQVLIKEGSNGKH